jgi:formamidopyrimidine-DNA glycosylase
MPEGPEVRRHADRLSEALVGHTVLDLQARTRVAKAWLAEHEGEVLGRGIERVFSHGKHLVGVIDGGYYFHSHLMMWGTWRVVAPDDDLVVTRDRRERARIVVADAAAVLLSAPVFDVGRGDPYAEIPMLASLGPDTLPYPEQGSFDVSEFRRRLEHAAEEGAEIGAALLNQRILAGLGNYLRAEILFDCAIDPWRPVRDLSAAELDCLTHTIPLLVERAYAGGGRTVTDEVHERMLADPSLVYQPGRVHGSKHYVFRRTNLPCVRCGDIVRQQRQVTGVSTVDEEEKTRIIYFCPTCQRTSVALPPARRRARRA